MRKTIKICEVIDDLFCIQLINVLFIILFTIQINNKAVSLFFLLTFFITVLMFALTLFTMNTRISDGCVVYVLLIIFFSFISILLKSPSISFEYIKKWIIFISSILMIFSLYQNHEFPHSKKICVVVTVLLSVVFNFYYYVVKLRVTYGTSQYLSMNFTNPNLTGMWIATCLLLLFFFIVSVKKKWLKLFIIANALLLLVPLYETGNRDSILVTFFYFIGFLFFRFNKKRRLSNSIIRILLLIPIVFVVLYMIFISRIIQSGFLNFLISPGKMLDSRYKIWSQSLLLLSKSFLTGDYFSISGGTGVSQLHNIHIDILCSYGVLTYILVVAFLFLVFCRKQREPSEYLPNFAKFTTLCIYCIGIGEAAIFSGGIGIYILSFSGMIYMRQMNEVSK